MRIKVHHLFLLILVGIIGITLGKDNNKTKLITGHKRHSYSQVKANYVRSKRALGDDEEDRPFWPHRGRRFPSYGKSDHERAPKMDKDPPFWGARGRRDRSALENYVGQEYPTTSTNAKLFATNCKQCIKTFVKNEQTDLEFSKERRDELSSPFWGNRGRRNSDDTAEENEPFWGNRGRRQSDEISEENNPFWGNRGRRNLDDNAEDNDPFWGNRGRRNSDESAEENDPFWGSRGRRQEEPVFWGSRGRRYDANAYDVEDPPFWGNRGRRDYKNRRREALKKVLKEAINTVEDNIESLTRMRRDNKFVPNSFWTSRGRDSQLKYLFKGRRHRYQNPTFLNASPDIHLKPTAVSTVLDDRIFAEEPHYIVIERSSRSSGEDDPFFISRGKKEFIRSHYSKAVRDRRGAIDELVKSVRNDPYYIARGKKDQPDIINGNSTSLHKELGKAKELICATIDLIFIKNEDGKTKREVNDNERERRTILKKLAAQLQMDPYFVSRGKKNESDINEDNLEEFFYEVSSKCN
ncbi:uncharacterized protein LOC126379739 [Pectinophora gossypiella]|uniref:uncharacterized protein LOC126379739 n=1 Tax=Pectinophora gossypiella TaxID=13191 RepID=UPI00214EB6EF|nr:uncharacterized protein LOC126379739 [Pectinophora gossypiella]